MCQSASRADLGVPDTSNVGAAQHYFRLSYRLVLHQVSASKRTCNAQSSQLPILFFAAHLQAVGRTRLDLAA